MGVVREHSVLIACIGAGSAVLAAFAKPICDALTPGDPPAQPPIIIAAPLDPTKTLPVGETWPVQTASSNAPASSPITPTPSSPAIEGTWKQYVLTPDEGAVYLGTFVVAKLNGEYVIGPRSQTEGDRFQNSIGVFDVAYDGAVWTYNTNWGNDEIGNFELKRVSPTMFEGEIRVAGQLSNRTRVVKVE